MKSKVKFALNYLMQKGIINLFLLVFLKIKNYRGKLAKKYIKRKTFDKNRPITSLDHIVKDYKYPSESRDFEHFLEFAPISLEERFEKTQFTYDEIQKEAERLLKINYSIHYHVFLEKTVKDIVEYGNKHNLFHFEIIDKKSTTNIKVDNEFVLILQKN